MGKELLTRMLESCSAWWRQLGQQWRPCARWLTARRVVRSRARFWAEVRAGQREAAARTQR